MLAAVAGRHCPRASPSAAVALVRGRRRWPKPTQAAAAVANRPLNLPPHPLTSPLLDVKPCSAILLLSRTAPHRTSPCSSERETETRRAEGTRGAGGNEACVQALMAPRGSMPDDSLSVAQAGFNQWRQAPRLRPSGEQGRRRVVVDVSWEPPAAGDVTTRPPPAVPVHARQLGCACDDVIFV